MNSKKGIALPVLMIAVGLGWLLTAHSVIPGVNWIWILGLAALGILVLALGGIDKVTVVLGPFLIIATFFSLLRQTGKISVDTEVPSLVIAAGALMLIPHIIRLPTPSWLIEPPRRE